MRTRLGAAAQVEPGKGGHGLRFFLSSQADFVAFADARKTALPQFAFCEAEDRVEPDEEE